MQSKNDYILQTYGDIIKEELNVKEIIPLDSAITVTKIYKPLGNKLSAKFGKDTGKIIQLGKEGYTNELPDGKLVISDGKHNEWLLNPDEYDVDYEWLSGDAMAADTGIVIKYDLEITPALAQEWLARELSRFLNQMRKDAGFSVEKKARCQYSTTSDILKNVITVRYDFLIKEALLSDIVDTKKPTGDHTDTFSTDEWSLIFALQTT